MFDAIKLFEDELAFAILQDKVRISFIDRGNELVDTVYMSKYE